MAVSRTSNVITTSTSGDTVVGPLRIKSIKVNAGATAGAATIAMNAITVYNSGTVAINTATYADEIDLMIPSGTTATITLAATVSIALYLALDGG